MTYNRRLHTEPNMRPITEQTWISEVCLAHPDRTLLDLMLEGQFSDGILTPAGWYFCSGAI